MIVHIPFATVETKKKTCGTVHLAVTCGTFTGDKTKCQMNKSIFMKLQGGEVCIKEHGKGGMNFQLLE